MSSLLAEHIVKYGYSVYAPHGRSLMDVASHPHETRLFDPTSPGAWPTVVDIQTVADYVSLQHEDFERFGGATVLQSLHEELKEGGLVMVPPYPLMLLEYTTTVFHPARKTDTKARVGVLLQTFRLSEVDLTDRVGRSLAATAVQDGAGHAEWFIETRTILQIEGEPVIMVPTGSTIYLDEDGAFITGHTDVLVPGTDNDVMGWRINAEWTTFTAMNACKFCHVRKAKVSEVEDAETKRRAKKAAKKGRPFVRHHKLVIEPLDKHMERVREMGPMTPGSKKALHAVRGHFATYTAEKPLGRGKFVGTVWRAPHMRGSKSLGLVTKDYETGSVDENDSDTMTP